MSADWLTMPRFIGIVEENCDNAAHGYGCEHLKPSANSDDPKEQELARLYEELEEAEDEVTAAEGAIEDAEAHRDYCEERRDDIQARIDKLEKPVLIRKAAA